MKQNKTKTSTFCDPNIANHQPVFTVLQVRNLPGIPTPSSRLQNLLCQYQFNDSGTNEKTSRKGKSSSSQKTVRRRRINGFIAFRSFYSKTIKGTSHQKELSSKLAAIWKHEPERHVWNTYALQYNATGGNESFVHWLNKNLGFISGHDEGSMLKTYKNSTLRNVEDVFLEASSLEGELFKIK